MAGGGQQNDREGRTVGEMYMEPDERGLLSMWGFPCLALDPTGQWQVPLRLRS